MRLERHYLEQFEKTGDEAFLNASLRHILLIRPNYYDRSYELAPLGIACLKHGLPGGKSHYDQEKYISKSIEILGSVTTGNTYSTVKQILQYLCKADKKWAQIAFEKAQSIDVFKKKLPLTLKDIEQEQPSTLMRWINPFTTASKL